MAQATRLMGGHLSMMSIGGTDVIADLENASLMIDGELQQAKALKDTWEYAIQMHLRWSIEVTVFVNTEPTLMKAMIDNTQVAIDFRNWTTPSVSYPAGKFTGNAIINRANLDSPDGPQTQKLTIIGQGALTYTKLTS